MRVPAVLQTSSGVEMISLGAAMGKVSVSVTENFVATRHFGDHRLAISLEHLAEGVRVNSNNATILGILQRLHCMRYCYR